MFPIISDSAIREGSLKKKVMWQSDRYIQDQSLRFHNKARMTFVAEPLACLHVIVVDEEQVHKHRSLQNLHGFTIFFGKSPLAEYVFLNGPGELAGLYDLVAWRRMLGAGEEDGEKERNARFPKVERGPVDDWCYSMHPVEVD
ncbi:uncharacterized protein LTHEOB_12052 [Lasiodiplodia theobromae]|uniref:uncharacterized protein n=1 Tax=Lasiodiplodia theobromae TaxID=45133 RepID=UPI0015C39A2B|nr:uncharacterized protein LTHEOB_12052 [Lasiodiplodia theobromae]KAF4536612.1 hypothetical protein LTHEOB_12052 [Lasiodiplodia theobromae]